MTRPQSTAGGVSLSGVHKTYGDGATAVHALRGVDLEVPEGQLVALTGRSGAGKTTLLHVVAGLRPADRGRIVVAGLDVTAADDDALVRLRRDTVGVIHQDFSLLPLLTAEENVGVPLRITRTVPRRRDQRVAELLERTGLTAHAQQRPDEMSGGQQQRVAIARALVNEPRVVLADEPTAQLDSETGVRIMELLHQMVVEEGATALVATHDPLIEQLADSVWHLEDGRVTETSGSSATGAGQGSR
jgi:putative ABC transport system ATP-binding protein